MEHRRGRHLVREPKPSGGLRAVHLNRLATAAGDRLNHLQDIGKDRADESTRLGADEDAAGDTLDLALTDQAGELEEVRGRDGLARRQVPYVMSNGLRSGHGVVLLDVS